MGTTPTFTAEQICQSFGPVLERLWTEREIPPRPVPIPLDYVAITAEAHELMATLVIVEREQKHRDLLKKAERTCSEESWSADATRQVVEPLRAKAVASYDAVTRELRDDDTRRDLERLTLMIRRHDRSLSAR
jgi:hypothetical protein